jgi:uncharacterized damage-inducible protein DinB
MIAPDYCRTMAAYNSEMNRRLYAAASGLSDAERRAPRGAFWGSIHGTLTHILWATPNGCLASTIGHGQRRRSSRAPT